MSDKNQGRIQTNISLNDVAALLIQIEPDNGYELAHFGELLDTLADDKSYPDASREKVVQARQKISDIMEQTDADSALKSEGIVEVGHLIEAAMNAAEDDLAPTSSSPRSERANPPSVTNASPPSFMPMDSDPELLNAFIAESHDLISGAEDALLSLETNPRDTDAVSTVFRAFHTIKGTAAFLDLSLISELAHLAESFLSRIRDGEIRNSGGYADLALRASDMLKELFHSAQEISGGEMFPKPEGYDILMETLASPERFGISETSSALPVSQNQKTDDFSGNNGPTETDEMEAVSVKADSEATEKQTTTSASPPAPSERKRPKITESSVRVPTDRLDRFVDMVGELVVSHSMVAQDKLLADAQHHELLKKVTLTSKIVRELQNMSMSMRMIPLKATFRKMARLVRDLSRKAGKKVTFVTEGEETEIDRNMVDVINDPLVHMVRNAVDHGIETPDERTRAGKPPHGTIRLSASHSAGNVVVKIEDDGRGLDRESIISKALEKGLIDDIYSKDDKALGDRDLFKLIFEPGFSTAKEVSEISGRGVGMDVVKKNIEELRGQMDIQSTPLAGSVFTVSLPLTLAIIDGMVVRVNKERYVMPTASIVRSVRPRSEEISTVIRRGEMLSLQGKLVPIFRLSRLFDIEDAETDLTRAIITVVEDNGRQVGLVIDELIGTQQIVIKTLGEAMKNILGISGSAIMPDGRVGLILDIGGLVRLANEVRR